MEHLKQVPIVPLRASKEEEEEEEAAKAFEASLPKEKGFLGPYLYFYQGFWCPSRVLHNVISFQKHFEAQDGDIILATKPKSGTTWLKALTFATINRALYPTNHSNHPLLTSNPHELVPFMEFNVYAHGNQHLLHPNNSCSRLFSTHIPYAALPKSIKDSHCRIVYLCRNPFDTFISFWEFTKGSMSKGMSLEEERSSMAEYLEYFSRGVEGFGPFWDHVLGYWKESLERPDKVLFVKYEDLKDHDGIREMKRLAEFLSFPFTVEEERGGAIHEIAKLCSLKILKDLEVNKKGKCMPHVENKMFFRKGEVGDWVNYFTTSMVELLDQVIKEKFNGTGLTFRFI
ncbi:hypothetical protein Nepgr_032640 [Nepenthes gracilis]|uniref:Sulfotransferase n=1 Tax=Nepenthes gracilis TaxID=150966 RepID=A0AAD3TL82_NEPGR|nr:hypothetical protein Nepgr_032640 [Nepenthes gracilis]